MVLRSHPESLPSIGLTRVTWRPTPDGGVRQTFESSTDGGKSWTVSFDGFYEKKGSWPANALRGPPAASA